MAAASSPVSHGELVEALGEAFDRVTVYRNLLDLVAAGLVSRTDLGDHVWRYELRRIAGAHASAHPHFLCVDCGTVACLQGVTVELAPSRKLPRAVVQRAVEVQIKGRCDDCVK